MGYSYELTYRAEKDLKEIISYIAHTLGDKTAAARFLDRFEKAVLEACDFPESGETVTNEFLPKGDFRKKLVGEYVCIYTPDDEKKIIYILGIIYGRRDMNEQLKRL